MNSSTSLPILLLTFALCLIYTTGLYGQQDDKSFYITTSLLSPTASLVPRWNIGIIKPINDKWMVGLEMEMGTYGLVINGQKGDTYIDKEYTSWLVQPQLYYILRQKEKVTKHLSLDVYYLRHTDVLQDASKQENRHYLEHGEMITYERANYFRRKAGININYGVQFAIYKRLSMDMSVGFGLRKRKVVYSQVTNPTNMGMGSDFGLRLGIYDFMKIRGDYVLPGTNGDIKLLYRIGK